jgi:hypothetical protein
MSGLLREILKKTESSTAKAMRLWVGNTIFNNTYAPEERVKFLQAELAEPSISLASRHPRSVASYSLPRQSDRTFRRLTGISQGLGPETMVYRHTHSGDISTRLKTLGGDHPDGRLVHFMIGNKGAAEAADKSFKDAIAAEGIVSHGKMFTTDDERNHQDLQEYRTCSGWRRPNIAHYRDIKPLWTQLWWR